MKIEMYINSTLLNNFYLIYKGNLLKIEIPKLHSEVTD
jgi:hypothetical protein